MVGGSDPRIVGYLGLDGLTYKTPGGRDSADAAWRVANRAAEKVAPTTLTFELPASMSHYAHDIRRFVDAMLYKLEKNAHKGKWDDLSVDRAFELLELEVAELKAEIGGNAVKTLLESADVANFALMIANIATERGK